MNTPELKLTFLGGADSIGASCLLVEVCDTALLVDCGIRFNSDTPLPDLSILHDKSLDAILVTHAHSDHTGGLPVLCQSFPRAPIYATPPTREITMILLRDALRLMNTPEREMEFPLYTEAQVDLVSHGFVPVHYGRSATVGDVTLTFLPAGHILGAAMIHLASPAGNLLFTGDYSITAQRTVPALTRPTLPVDFLITEATYGDRLHEDRAAAEKRLISSVAQVVANGGKVLIPAFAVGRAQEILLILKAALRNKTLPEVPVYIDGMVRAVCGVYARHERYTTRSLAHDARKTGHAFFTGGIEPVSSPKQRHKIVSGGPCIIVASSGMLSGGASAFYAEKLVPNPKDAIFITGYQDEESPGHALLKLADTDTTEKEHSLDGPASNPSKKNKEIKVNGKTLTVNCRFEKYGLSAHGDRMQMTGLIEKLAPQTVALVHGDEKARKSLCNSLGCADIILAENGMALTKCLTLKNRKNKSRPEIVIDKAAAKKLLGSPKGKPLLAEQITSSWLGKKATAHQTNQFIEQLENFELVQRDDVRRQYVYVLDKTADTAALESSRMEQQLKKENPKGKLLEFCMRQKIPFPQTQFTTKNNLHTATMVLIFNDQVFDSGSQNAASKKTAEQLAAQNILTALQRKQDLQTIDTKTVHLNEFEQLKLRNPKGKLIEWCSQNGISPANFETQTHLDTVKTRATLTFIQNPVISDWYCGPTKKITEQAAAHQLLQAVNEKGFIKRNSAQTLTSAPKPTAPSNTQWTHGDEKEHLTQNTADDSPPIPSKRSSPPQKTDPDPQMRLNELQQLDVIYDFGYEFQPNEGPSHNPIFTVIGWVELLDGSQEETVLIKGPSKKATRKKAAGALISLLQDLNVLAKLK